MKALYSNNGKEYCFVDGGFISRGGFISFDPTEMAKEKLRIRTNLSEIETQIASGELLIPEIPTEHIHELSEMFHNGISEKLLYFKAFEILELVKQDANYIQLISNMKLKREQEDPANFWKHRGEQE